MGLKMRAILLLLMPVVLTACVTSDVAPTVVPVARGQASVTINRPDAYYASAVPTELDVNGARITSLASGGSYTGPIPPGPVTLSATSWSSPGRYTCLLYTSDAADDLLCVDLGGRRIIKK